MLVSEECSMRPDKMTELSRGRVDGEPIREGVFRGFVDLYFYAGFSSFFLSRI